MAIKKQFLKSKPVCKVKFTVSKAQAAGAASVYLVGDFNDWNPEATAMTPLKSGAFTTTLNLDKDCEYQFRYLAGSDNWLNEDAADRFVPGNIGDEENSLIAV